MRNAIRGLMLGAILAVALAAGCGGEEDAPTTVERSAIHINGTTFTADPVSGYYSLPDVFLTTTGCGGWCNNWTMPSGLFHFFLHSPRTSPWYAVNFWENANIQCGVTEPDRTSYSAAYYSPDPNQVATGADYADWRSNHQIRWQVHIPTGAVWNFECQQDPNAPIPLGTIKTCNIHRHWPNAPSRVDEAFNVPVTVRILTPIPVQ